MGKGQSWREDRRGREGVFSEGAQLPGCPPAWAWGAEPQWPPLHHPPADALLSGGSPALLENWTARASVGPSSRQCKRQNGVREGPSLLVISSHGILGPGVASMDMEWEVQAQSFSWVRGGLNCPGLRQPCCHQGRFLDMHGDSEGLSARQLPVLAGGLSCPLTQVLFCERVPSCAVGCQGTGQEPTARTPSASPSCQCSLP